MSTLQRWTWDITLLGDTDMKIAQFPDGVVNQNTGVLVSVSELTREGLPFMGRAFISVWNVVPMDGSRLLLAFRVEPDFSNIRVRVQILITNN